jgi:nucleoid DNA-binding protein
MDELTKLVAQRTGLPQDKAKVVVDTVVNYLKKKLPPSVAGQLDVILTGGDLPDNLTESL